MCVSMSQSQAEGDIGTEVFEVAVEGDLPIGDCDRGCLFELVISPCWSDRRDPMSFL